MVELAMYGSKQSIKEILRQYKLALEVNSSAFKFTSALGNCQGICQGKFVFSLMCVNKLLRRRNCLNNIHVNFWINYCNYIITIINNKRETINKKTKKVCSMDKTLVGIEESAGAVIQRCSVN